MPAEAQEEQSPGSEVAEPTQPERTGLEQAEDSLVMSLAGVCSLAGMAFAFNEFSIYGPGAYLAGAILGGLIGMAVLRLLFWGSLKAMGKTERPFAVVRRRG